MVRSTGPFWDAVHQTLWENFDPRTKRVMISLSNASVFDRVAERVPATAQPQRKSALAQIGAKRKQLEVRDVAVHQACIVTYSCHADAQNGS